MQRRTEMRLMSKRRVQDQEDSDIDVSSTDSENELEQEIVDVDFEFFDLNPDVDFHATKTFLKQLFGDDNVEFDISGITDLFLTKNSVGTSIKTDGKDSDPYAILSVVNISDNRDKSSIKTLMNYILAKTKDLEFNRMLKKLIDSDKGMKLGLIISERVINMPVEVVPPMYKMLLEEMTKADDSHEKYEFEYFLVISKVYQIVGAEIEQPKSSKKKKAASTVEMDYYHYEDMVLEKNAVFHGYYSYNNVNQETDSRRVFQDYGIDPKLSLILIDKKNLAKSVPEMEEQFPPY